LRFDVENRSSASLGIFSQKEVPAMHGEFEKTAFLTISGVIVALFSAG
jgi:hypothetical protein